MALIYPEDVDQRLTWPLGRAARLARQGKLPHVLLPDGSVRFRWEIIAAMVRQIPVKGLTLADQGLEGWEIIK